MPESPLTKEQIDEATAELKRFLVEDDTTFVYIMPKHLIRTILAAYDESLYLVPRVYAWLGFHLDTIPESATQELRRILGPLPGHAPALSSKGDNK